MLPLRSHMQRPSGSLRKGELQPTEILENVKKQSHGFVPSSLVLNTQNFRLFYTFYKHKNTNFYSHFELNYS